MKISVLIIAHNEERYIEECINSVLNQTKKPDEIVLVVHNSTDRTYALAQKYPILTILFTGQEGIVHARTKGISHISGEIILGLDGDSVVERNWVEFMSETLKNNQNVLVGSWVKFKGTFFGSLANIFNKYKCVTRGRKATHWIWGSSFAFWGKDREIVRDIWEKTEALSENLKLSRNPDDFWLSLFMNLRGNIEVTNNTFVTQYTKESTTLSAFKRNIENIRNGNQMEKWFKRRFEFKK